MYLVKAEGDKIVYGQYQAKPFTPPEGYEEIEESLFNQLKFYPATITRNSQGKITSILNAPEPPEYNGIEEVDEAVVRKIRTRYTLNEEAKMLRLGILDANNEEFIAYNQYIEECRVWGHDKKVELGLVTETA